MIVAVVVALVVWLMIPAGGSRAADSAVMHRLSERCRSLWGRASRSRTSSNQRDEAVHWLDALISELRSGRPPRVAVVLASEADGVCSRARAAAALGGDVAQALRADAAAANVAVLSRVAACWSVGESAGAGLVSALEQVATAARDEAEVRAEVAAQVAAPRATARLLAGLPLAGVVLGTSMGASPMTWLLGSPLGWFDLSAGIGLAALGLWWTGRMVSAVEREVEVSGG